MKFLLVEFQLSWVELIACQVLTVLRQHHPDIVALDGNLSPHTLETVAKYCNESGINGKYILQSLLFSLLMSFPLPVLLFVLFSYNS